MTKLIPLHSQTIDGNAVETVNARELHEFLESKRQFADWIKNRIEQYDFIENQDFVRFHKKMKANNATMIDYHITLDMAKELSMVERNEKGKHALMIGLRTVSRSMASWKIKTLLVFWLLPKNLMAVAQAKSTTSHLIWQNSLLW